MSFKFLLNNEPYIREKLEIISILNSEIIDMYFHRWESCGMDNFAKKNLPKEFKKLYGNMFLMHVDNCFIFQLNGPLPIVTTFTTKNEDAKKARRINVTFIRGHVLQLCAQLKDEGKIPNKYLFGPENPAGIVFVHYLHGPQVFDLENVNTKVMINALKGTFFKDDSVKHLKAFSQFFREADINNIRTLMYVGREDKMLRIISKTINEYKDISLYPQAMISRYPLHAMTHKFVFSQPKEKDVVINLNSDSPDGQGERFL